MTLISPRTHIAFAPCKLVRTGIITDAIARGGAVWVERAEQQPALLRFQRTIAKVREEWAEVQEIYARTGSRDLTNDEAITLAEELADVEEVFALLQDDFLTDITLKEGDLPDGKLSTLWHTLHLQALEAPRLTPALRRQAARLVLRTEIALESRTRDLTGGKRMVENAAETKNAKSGHLEGHYCSFLALPKGDEWVPAFKRKFPQVALDHTNPAAGLTRWS